MRTRAILTFASAISTLGLVAGCFPTDAENAAAAETLRTQEESTCLTPDEAERMADQVLELINLERTSLAPEGNELPLAPVAMNPTLSRIANDYACRMIEENFFGHRDPITGYGPGERAIVGKYYLFHAVGENLAAGQETPAEVMRVWMESPSHADIILDSAWREVGVSVRSGGEHGIYWVLEFGDPFERTAGQTTAP